jgi:acyl-CoA hydrolase
MSRSRSCLSLRPRAVIEDDPEGKHFHLFSWHFSAYERGKHDVGRCNYTPLNLGEVPDYYRRFLDPVDIAILKTCPMDDGGYFNLWLLLQLVAVFLDERAQTALPSEHEGKALKLLHHRL